MVYRAPISSGRDAIGMAVGGALAGGADILSRGADERRRRQLEEEEIARRDLLDRRNEEERQRRIRAEERAQALADAEMGVISQQDAMTGGDPIQEAARVGGRMQAPTLQAPRLLPAPGGATFQGGSQAPKLREGVTQVGGMFIDPARSLAARREEVEFERQRSRENQLLEEAADRYMELDPTMSRGDAIARAAGIETTGALTFEDELSQRRQLAELEDEFRIAQEGREEKRARTLLGTQRTQSTAEGLALTLADEAIRRANPLSTNLAFVRSHLRQQARQQGLNLTEGEIQQIALRAVYMVEDQIAQHAPDDDDFFDTGGDIDLDEPVDTGALRAEQREWDEDFREAQSISDPRKRQEALRILGDRPR